MAAISECRQPGTSMLDTPAERQRLASTGFERRSHRASYQQAIRGVEVWPSSAA